MFEDEKYNQLLDDKILALGLGGGGGGGGGGVGGVLEVRNGENASYKDFILFSWYSQKVACSGPFELRIVWQTKSINPYLMTKLYTAYNICPKWLHFRKVFENSVGIIGDAGYQLITSISYFSKTVFRTPLVRVNKTQDTM